MRGSPLPSTRVPRGTSRTTPPLTSALSSRLLVSLPYLVCCAAVSDFTTAQFITACPSGYKFPPVTQFPALTLSSAAPRVGDMLDVKFTNKANTATTYLAFYSGLNVFFSEIKNGQAMVPSNLTNSGQVYAAVVSNNTGTPSDSQTLSGLAILSFPFSAEESQANF
jgi:hypothetical protein